MGETASVIASGVGAGAQILEGEQEHRRITDNRREQRAALDDLAYRREATYRNSRMMLQGAIEDFYKQKGWQIPERLPGAYTVRGLPGEAPLYPGVSRENPSFSLSKDSEAGSIAERIPVAIGSSDNNDSSEEDSSSSVGTNRDVSPEQANEAYRKIGGVTVKMPEVIGTPVAPTPGAVYKDPIYIPNRSLMIRDGILQRIK